MLNNNKRRRLNLRIASLLKDHLTLTRNTSCSCRSHISRKKDSTNSLAKGQHYSRRIINIPGKSRDQKYVMSLNTNFN